MTEVIHNFIELRQCPFCSKDFEYKASNFRGDVFELYVYDNFIEIKFAINPHTSLPEELVQELYESPMIIRLFSDGGISCDPRLKKYLLLYALQFRIGKQCELYPFHQFRQSLEISFVNGEEPDIHPFYEQISFIEGDNYYFLGNGGESMANLAQSEIKIQNKFKKKTNHTLVDRIFFHKLDLTSVENIISALDAVSLLG